MDYQPMNQPVEESASAGGAWYTIGIIAVIAALAIWYYSSTKSPATGQPTATEQTQTSGGLSAGNTTADITSDLNQTSDGSDALNADAAASVQAVSGF